MIKKLLFALIGNGTGLYVSHLLLPEFMVQMTIEGFLTATGVLTAVNLLLRPIIKLVFIPLILLTLGGFTILINAGILYGLAFFLESITINSVLALIEGTLIISGVNIVLRVLHK
jgi:putative membrane protein